MLLSRYYLACADTQNKSFHQFEDLKHLAETVMEKEGLKGFYRGYLFHLVRGTGFSWALVFYEKLRYYSY